MDLSMAMGQFTDSEGNINLPPNFTLSGLSEMIFQAERMMGRPDRPQFRHYDYSTGSEKVTEYSRHEVNQRVKAVAQRLQQITKPGEHVTIMAGNCPEYMFAFLGALYAGVVPVPMYDPQEPGHADHLASVLDTAEPTIVLTTKAAAGTVRSYFADRPSAERPRILAVDALPNIASDNWQLPEPVVPEGQDAADNTAFLQFTSGSTRTPAGVQLTHRSIITNLLQIFRAGQLHFPARGVLWVPLHHDMGLILAAFVLMVGQELDLLSPRDFIQHPERFLRVMSAREGDGLGEGERAIYTAVPNFALDLCVRFADPAQNPDLQDLDFSAVDGMICGSEPVTERCVREFTEMYAPYNFRKDALRPGLGMAEASLLVSVPQAVERPKVLWLDREALSAGRAEQVEVTDPTNPPAGVMSLMGLGEPTAAASVTVVDPETGEELPDDRIGELWIHGDNVASGYYGRPDETTQTFENVLAADKRLSDGSRATKVADDAHWLASGDLGMFHEDQVYVTGRLKDLIVVGGRNHYPQDVEFTVESATDHVRATAVAAFSVEGDDTEGLVVIAERDPSQAADGDDAAIDAIRAAISQRHGLSPKDVRIVAADAIPRSSSAKIARRVAKKAYEEGRLG